MSAFCYLGLLISPFDLSDFLDLLTAAATFKWFFTFIPPEFSLAMRSAVSLASLFGTVPLNSTCLSFFMSTVILAVERVGSFWMADWIVSWISPPFLGPP